MKRTVFAAIAATIALLSSCGNNAADGGAEDRLESGFQAKAAALHGIYELSDHSIMERCAADDHNDLYWPESVLIDSSQENLPPNGSMIFSDRDYPQYEQAYYQLYPFFEAADKVRLQGEWKPVAGGDVRTAFKRMVEGQRSVFPDLAIEDDDATVWDTFSSQKNFENQPPVHFYVYKLKENNLHIFQFSLFRNTGAFISGINHAVYKRTWPSEGED